MSKRAGGGNVTVTRGLCGSYLHKMIEEIKTSNSEVKASKSDKRLRRLWPFKDLHFYWLTYPKDVH